LNHQIANIEILSFNIKINMAIIDGLLPNNMAYNSNNTSDKKTIKS